jgi:hypothetical protein
VDAAREVETYKALLVETQMQQLYVSREYQKLFAEKHQEIAKLQAMLHDLDASALEGLNLGGDKQADGSSSASADQTKDNDQVEYISRTEFEVKMKDLVAEKSGTSRVPDGMDGHHSATSSLQMWQMPKVLLALLSLVKQQTIAAMIARDSVCLVVVSNKIMLFVQPHGSV